MKNNEYSYPVFLITSGLAKSGHLVDLAPGQFGVFHRNPSQYVATSPKERDELFLAIGSVRKFDKLGQQAGYKLPTESSYFRVKDIRSFEVSDPSKKMKSNTISVGFSGGSCSEGIKFKCDTTYTLNVIVTGSPALRELGRPYYRTFSYNTGCCPKDNCVDCESSASDCQKHTKAIVEMINKDVESVQIGLKARFVTSTYKTPVFNQKKYSIEVCDDGDQNALNAIQANVGKLGKVVKVSRKDCKSVYEYCGDSVATSYTPSQSVSLAVCGTCPTGFTLVPDLQTVTVIRPIESTTDTSTTAAQAIVANAIAGSYGGANALFNSANGATVSATFTVAAGVTPVAVLSDQVVLGIVRKATCNPTSAVTPIDWTPGAPAYKAKRKLKITLKRAECSNLDRLAELTAYYNTNPEYVPTSLVKLPGSVGCEDCYEIEQWSKGCMTDDCLSPDAAQFNSFGSFLGELWEVVPEVLPVDLNRKCGFTLEAELTERYLSNCAFSSEDFYETEPMHIEAGWEVNYPEVCSADELPVIKDKGGVQYIRQSGETIVRQLIEGSAYDWACGYSDDPLMRERLGQELLNQVDRKAFYKIYYLKFLEARVGSNAFAEQPRLFEPVIFVKDTDPVAFELENYLTKITSLVNVNLTKRENHTW